jgi:transmembrane protein EpsG
MIPTFILGLLSIIFAYIARYRQTRWGLKVSFGFVFLFLALRYEFGNDYRIYHDSFLIINSSSPNSLSYFLKHFEPGWILLNWLFKSIGFFSMTAFLALCNCIVYYKFITKHVDNKLYWFSIFLYIFYPNFMLIHSSAMRQSVAILLIIYSIDFLLNKNAAKYFLCVGIASLFHYPAIIFIPIYFLRFVNYRIRIVYGFIILLAFVSLFIVGEHLVYSTKQFIAQFTDKYEYYSTQGSLNTGVGFLYYFTLLTLLVYYERFQDRETALVFKIAILSFMFMPLTLILEILSRAGMYFAPATLVAYPNIILRMKTPIIRIILSTVIILITLYQFTQFFFSDTYSTYFMEYQTILSAPRWY